MGHHAVLIWQIWVIALQKYFPLTPACGECKWTAYFCLPLSPGTIVYLLIEFAASQGVTETEGERILIFFQRELSAPEDINIWGTWAPSACSHPIHYCLFIHFSYPGTCGRVWCVSSEGVHSSHEPACNGMCGSVCVCARFRRGRWIRSVIYNLGTVPTPLTVCDPPERHFTCSHLQGRPTVQINYLERRSVYCMCVWVRTWKLNRGADILANAGVGRIVLKGRFTEKVKMLGGVTSSHPSFCIVSKNQGK